MINMSKWVAKTKGALQRLNSQLKVSEIDNTLIVDHSVYGRVILLTPEDENPIALVREVLADLSEKYNK